MACLCRIYIQLLAAADLEVGAGGRSNTALGLIVMIPNRNLFNAEKNAVSVQRTEREALKMADRERRGGLSNFQSCGVTGSAFAGC